MRTAKARKISGSGSITAVISRHCSSLRRGSSLGYGLLLGLVIAGNVEFLLDNIDSMNLRVLFSWILIGYIVLIGTYFAAVYISSMIRYNRARRNVKEYLTALERISRMQ